MAARVRKATGLFLLIFMMVSIVRLNAQETGGIRTLYLIRHGEYTYREGSDDSEKTLTPLGIAQTRLLSERLKSMDVEFSSLISSTLTRAIETAEVINQYFPGLELKKYDMLSECTPPTWREDIMKGVDPAHRTECSEKLDEAFKKFFVPSPDDRERHDIIVCHGNVIRYMVTKVLKVNTMSWLQMSITNCSLTIIRIKPDGSMNLDAFGDYGHIPENMRTFTGGDNKPKELLLNKER